ncbi:MAG: tetratricopeptide repeat protein [Deltaproteobacteria bacterium]
MRLLVVAAALVACGRGGQDDRKHDHGSAAVASVSVPSLVPKLGISDDGVAALARLDHDIPVTADQPARHLNFILTRATYRGRVEDYQAADRFTADWVTRTPDQQEAWSARTRALLAIHEFEKARDALEHVKKLANDPSQWRELAVALDEATGHRDRSTVARLDDMKANPNTMNETLYAASLALEGKFDLAIAQIPKAAAQIHDNSPFLFAWLYFQWGRLYEQKGDYASARAFYQEAHARIPGYVEANAHLAQTMMLTGDTAGAKQVVTAALAGDRNPALLDLAAQLGLGSVDAARTEWERYVAALPKAFSDHAARFFVATGKDPKRAEELAKANLANRDVPEARELVVQAALAAGDTAGACDAAGPLAGAALRAHRFAAWQAFSRCGRTADAARLAKNLGISP